MAGLVKATLADASAKNDPGIPVQLNPTSLRFQMSNSVDAARTSGSPGHQSQGTRSMTLTMDLVFDTADEGAPGSPVNVRSKTQQIARFVLPAPKSKKQVPPRVRFTWGELVVEGVMTTMTEEIDLFSPEGVPLRAKVNISISEQRPQLATLKEGSGANQGADAREPGGGGAGPGSAGGGFADRTGIALGGEMAADFAARVGLDPAAWRDVTAGLDASMSFEAGAQVDFSAGASFSAGIGASVGFEVGASATLEAGLGLEIGGTAGIGGPAGISGTASAAGFALAAAGGVAAATATVTTNRATAAAAGARQAFGPAVPAAQAGGPRGAAVVGATGAAAAGASGGRVTGGAGGSVAGGGGREGDGRVRFPDAGSRGPGTGPSPSRLLPIVDRRAASFGFGVPLRPRVGGAAEERAALIAGAPRSSRPSGPVVAVTRDPTVPPWVALPARPPARRHADEAQADRRPDRCACRWRRDRSARCAVCGGAR